jgi:hypothetical protein
MFRDLLNETRVGQRPPIAALSGSLTKAPGFAGGYLLSAPEFRSIALTLSSCHSTAIVPVDRGGDGAAVLPRADGYAPRADTDGEIAISPIAPLTPVAIDPIIPVATNLHVAADLCHFEVFRLGNIYY